MKCGKELWGVHVVSHEHISVAYVSRTTQYCKPKSTSSLCVSSDLISIYFVFLSVSQLGGNGSAFEHVPKLNIPANPNWGPGLLQKDHPDPPVVSVTAPQEDSIQESRPATLNVPDTKVTGLTSPGGSGRSSPDSEGKNEGEIFHKFDKWRKKYPAQHSDQEESKRMEELTLNDESECSTSEVLMDTQDPNLHEKEIDKSEKTKKSAGEAHPQLLAQLKAAPQFKPIIHSNFGAVSQNMASSDVNRRENRNNIVLTVPQTAFLNRISPSHSPSSLNKSASFTDDMIRCAQELSTRKSDPYGNCTQNRETENHAHTVSHLKDKLMRKYDSSENLTTIGQDGNQVYPQGYPNGQVNLAGMQQLYGGQYYPGYAPPVRMDANVSGRYNLCFNTVST